MTSALLGALLCWAAPLAAHAIPVLSFDVVTPVHVGPGTAFVDEGDPLVVDVNVSGLSASGSPSVRSFDLTVTFGSAQVTLNTVVFGSGLGTPLSQTTDTSVPGQVQVQEVSFEPAAFFNSQPAAFTLFTLNFTADSAGFMTLAFLDNPPGNPVLLSDVDGSPLSPALRTQGVRVVPEPVFLAALGLAVALRRRSRTG